MQLQRQSAAIASRTQEKLQRWSEAHDQDHALLPFSSKDRVIAHSNREQLDSRALVIDLWLLDNYALAYSECTTAIYREIAISFQAYLQERGLDLDSPVTEIALHMQTWARRRAPGSRYQGSVAPSTYNQRVAAMSSFYRWAKRSGKFTGDNPAEQLTRAYVEKYAKSQALNSQSVYTKLKGIDRTTPRGLRDYVLLQVALNTGRTARELASLVWKCVHLDDEIVTLTFEHCKGGKTMHDTLDVRLSKLLLIYLRTIYEQQLDTLAPNAPLWVSFSDRTNRKAIGPQTIADICESHLGISTIQSLRHTFALTMEQQGAQTRTIQGRLGHESPSSTDMYLTQLKRAHNPYAGALADVFGVEEAFIRS